MLPTTRQVADSMIGSLEAIRQDRLPSGTRILDFGCGMADMIFAWREQLIYAVKGS
jgi:ubiquinone/menaquinone biosynthesis C-methylase UbiE